MGDGTDLWSYLSTEPLWWLTCTLLAYLAADWVSARLRRHPLANPVLIAVCMIALVIQLVGAPYATYFDGAKFIHFLLGPATVALAVPLYSNLPAIRKLAVPMLAALLAGSLTAAGSAVLLSQVLGLPDEVIVSMSPKSTTAPVAIGISEALGGLPSLTAVLVILTGIIGAVAVTPLMNALKVRDWRARGFAVGIAAHGIGTARAFQVSEIAGAFAGIGMALNAILTSILVPIIIALLL
ncbi:LrgB family protein [Rhodobacteraceae bacterium 2CG4]|uniref:LrgB family protein n=1 Tax=Halovulum marinum TaxID=2662447 RepID=A0A6L5Z2M0_9RHOB|nr:LrgB family protein [Halovulum marinum]MSU90320.1 LrgB family protein [Halovulum marinum]